MSLILQHALAYAANGWKVFRLSKAKVPLKGTHGHLDATTDPVVIREWFHVVPTPNVGLACGEVVAIDLDGPTALDSKWGCSLKELAKRYGGLPETLIQATRRGVHLLYRVPPGVEIRTKNEPRSGKGADGVDIKGLGGYIVLTPSTSKGFQYHFLNAIPPAVMPDWLVEWCLTIGGGTRQQRLPDITRKLGEAPAYLKAIANQRNITGPAARALQTEWSSHEEARLRSALAAIPVNCGYDAFLRIGFALRGLDWERSDGTSIAYDLFEEWCSRSEHFNPAGLQAKWEELGRSSRGEVSIGTVLQYAKEAGWRGQIESEVMPTDPRGPSSLRPDETRPQPSAAPVGAAPLLQGPDFAQPVIRGVVFQDTTENGFPKATMGNAAQAIEGLGISCTKDLFHDELQINGQTLGRWVGNVTDAALYIIRKRIREAYKFDPGEVHTRHAVELLCVQHCFDPLVDYLDSLEWDGKPRLDTWLSAYMGAEDTPLNRAIGRLVLCAAVRRAYKPGHKFDQILVLEGVEGKGKSSAIEILAGGPRFYSDQSILGHNDREQLEAMNGVWLYEIGELQGMRRAEVERVKAFASRTVDRARPAYGHFRVDKPRRCVFIATTNDDSYLRSETGNRRFWPVVTRDIDLAALRRDRDQLWAEASCVESQDRPLVLDPQLWHAAAEEQEQRLEENPLLEPIIKYLEDAKNPRHDVSAREVLQDNPHLQMEAGHITSIHLQRAGHVLRKLRWHKYRKRRAAGVEWRWRRTEA